MTVSFKCTPQERAAINRVVERAEIHKLVKGEDQRLSLRMDLAAANANGSPIDFARLLNAEDFDFFHDVCGIIRHMDRETGKLGGCFVPRCSR